MVWRETGMSSTQFPPYIQRSADYNSGLPYTFARARYYNFVLKGEMDMLQRLCDTYLNRPSRFWVKVKPLSPFLIVTFADYPKAYSAQLPPEKYGFMQYQEMVLTLVVKSEAGPCGLGGGMYAFIPFLFLDNPRAIAAGREVFSLPKVHATVSIPPPGQLQQAIAFTSELMALPSYGRLSQARMCEILRVTAPSGMVAQGSPGDSVATWDSIDSHVYGSLGDEARISQTDAQALTRSMQMSFINLRQFRGFPATHAALAKSIFLYKATQVSFSDGGPLIGDFRLEFPMETPMFPLKSTCGLLERIYSAYWYEWSFQFELGENLWESGQARLRPQPL